VVVLNWERPHLTLRCLDSLLAAEPRPHQVVVVDNASRDDSVRRVEEWAAREGVAVSVLEPHAPYECGETWLTVIRAPENRGFSRGNNHGLRFLSERSGATHFLLLNNDARVRADTFAELLRALDDRPDAGILTGTIFVDDEATGPPAVWYAGGIEKPLRGLTAHITTLPSTDTVRAVEFVSGCAMLISRAVLSRIGLLPECYEPGYCEDAEYSRQARLAGLSVLYAPRAAFYHMVGATAGSAADSEAVTYAQIRHRIFYIRRNFRGPLKAIALGYTVLTKPGRALIWAARGKPRIGYALLRGTLAGVTTRFSDRAGAS
jgi:GT2 family glycosyltransferase